MFRWHLGMQVATLRLALYFKVVFLIGVYTRVQKVLTHSFVGLLMLGLGLLAGADCSWVRFQFLFCCVWMVFGCFLFLLCACVSFFLGVCCSCCSLVVVVLCACVFGV